MWQGSPMQRKNSKKDGGSSKAIDRFFQSMVMIKSKRELTNSQTVIAIQPSEQQKSPMIQKQLSIAQTTFGGEDPTKESGKEQENPIPLADSSQPKGLLKMKLRFQSVLSGSSAILKIKNNLKETNEKIRLKKKPTLEENKKNIELESLFFALNQLSREERFKKAERHFSDSLALMPVRHDLELCESWFVLAVYFWQTGPIWGNIMFIIGLLFPLVSLFEPANMHVKDYNDNFVLFNYEFSALILIWMDIILEAFHLQFDKDRSLAKHYIFNSKLSTRVLVALVLLLDMIYFHSSFPVLTYRFSRYLRPFLVFYYSNELRRTLISIVESVKQISQLVVFLFCLMFFFAFIAWKIIGDLDGVVQFDEFASDFTTLSSAATAFYGLISFDNYPDAMLPAFSVNKMYSVFFIVYCVLLVLLLIPIPVSVVYEAFRVIRLFLLFIFMIVGGNIVLNE